MKTEREEKVNMCAQCAWTDACIYESRPAKLTWNIILRTHVNHTRARNISAHIHTLSTAIYNVVHVFILMK